MLAKITALVLLLALPAAAQVPVSQSLPLTARAQFGKTTIELEVARTEQEQAIGLMGRKELPANRGMLFIFNPPRFVSFWMGNCFIPLDMVFVRQGRITSFAAKAKPCPTAQNCPSYPSKAEIDQVIELQAGQIQALNLKVKDPVTVSFLKEPALK